MGWGCHYLIDVCCKIPVLIDYEKWGKFLTVQSATVGCSMTKQFTAKCLHGKTLMAKCSYCEMSSRGSVLTRNVLTQKFSCGEVPVLRNLTGEMSHGEKSYGEKSGLSVIFFQ